MQPETEFCTVKFLFGLAVEKNSKRGLGAEITLRRKQQIVASPSAKSILHLSSSHLLIFTPLFILHFIGEGGRGDGGVACGVGGEVAKGGGGGQTKK